LTVFGQKTVSDAIREEKSLSPVTFSAMQVSDQDYHSLTLFLIYAKLSFWRQRSRGEKFGSPKRLGLNSVHANRIVLSEHRFISKLRKLSCELLGFELVFEVCNILKVTHRQRLLHLLHPPHVHHLTRAHQHFTNQVIVVSERGGVRSLKG
jgi:hypothetical protein